MDAAWVPLLFQLAAIGTGSRMPAGQLRRSAAVVLITGSALALCLGFPPSAQTYFGVLSIVLAFGLAAVIIGALSDSGWYFALMEDYRDRYVWHIHPHPDLMFSSKDE